MKKLVFILCALTTILHANDGCRFDLMSDAQRQTAEELIQMRADAENAAREDVRESLLADFRRAAKQLHDDMHAEQSLEAFIAQLENGVSGTQNKRQSNSQKAEDIVTALNGKLEEIFTTEGRIIDGHLNGIMVKRSDQSYSELITKDKQRIPLWTEGYFIRSGQLSLDGKMILETFPGGIGVFDSAASKSLFKSNGAVVSPNGKYIILNHGDRWSVRNVDSFKTKTEWIKSHLNLVKKYKRRNVLRIGHRASNEDIVFSPNGNLAAVMAYEDSTRLPVHLVDLRTGRRRINATLDRVHGMLRHESFIISNEGDVALKGDGEVILHNEPIKVGGEIEQWQFSPDGKRIAVYTRTELGKGPLPEVVWQIQVVDRAEKKVAYGVLVVDDAQNIRFTDDSKAITFHDDHKLYKWTLPTLGAGP